MPPYGSRTRPKQPFFSLHDIWKVGVRPDFLLKPGRLDADEFEKTRQHVPIDHRILYNAKI